jgi:spore germination protein KA
MLPEYIKNNLMPHNSVKEASEHQIVIDDVNFGGCGIYIDGLNLAFTTDVKGWKSMRSGKTKYRTGNPRTSGGFNEVLRVNTALIKKRA